MVIQDGLMSSRMEADAGGTPKSGPRNAPLKGSTEATL